MKTRIVRIGNSQGVRIPKPLLEQAGLRGEVELSVEKSTVIIKHLGKARQGWSRAFQAMARRGDDALLDDVSPSLTDWDKDKWEWR